MKFGEYLKRLRCQQGFSLRDFASLIGVDSGNLSKIERGILKPPADKKLEIYASSLGIEFGSEHWYEFFDHAAVSRNTIPADIAGDEGIREVMPAFFNMLRNELPSPEIFPFPILFRSPEMFTSPMIIVLLPAGFLAARSKAAFCLLSFPPLGVFARFYAWVYQLGRTHDHMEHRMNLLLNEQADHQRK